MTTTWHLDDDLARRYAGRDLDPVRVASVEAHLGTCAPCQRLVSGGLDDPLLAAVWAGVLVDLDRPRPSLLERAVRRLGVSDVTARLGLAVTQARLAVLAAAVVSLVLALVAAGSRDDSAFGVFLVAAPLGPLLATAAAFGLGDPADALVRTTPTPWLRILLVRLTISVLPAMAVALAASLWLRDQGWVAAAWLLPSLALAAATVALATWTPIERAALVVGLAWLTPFALTRVKGPALVEAFGTTTQATSAVVLLAAVAVASIRRTSFEYGENR